jgi:hypothetical protein
LDAQDEGGHDRHPREQGEPADARLRGQEGVGVGALVARALRVNAHHRLGAREDLGRLLDGVAVEGELALFAEDRRVQRKTAHDGVQQKSGELFVEEGGPSRKVDAPRHPSPVERGGEDEEVVKGAVVGHEQE